MRFSREKIFLDAEALFSAPVTEARFSGNGNRTVDSNGRATDDGSRGCWLAVGSRARR